MEPQNLEREIVGSKYLKPKKVRDVTLRAMRSCGVPEEMSLELVRGNEFAYQQLSGYVHGNLAAMTLSAFTAEGKKLKPTFGGSMTEYTRTVANQMVNFWFILLQSLCKILRDVHGWCPDESLEPSYRDMALAGTFQSAAVVALARRSRKRKLEQGD